MPECSKAIPFLFERFQPGVDDSVGGCCNVDEGGIQTIADLTHLFVGEGIVGQKGTFGSNEDGKGNNREFLEVHFTVDVAVEAFHSILTGQNGSIGEGVGGAGVQEQLEVLVQILFA